MDRRTAVQELDVALSECGFHQSGVDRWELHRDGHRITVSIPIDQSQLVANPNYSLEVMILSSRGHLALVNVKRDRGVTPVLEALVGICS